MGAVYFYQLTNSPLDVTLPALLVKARAAGWQVVVRGRAPEHMKWLDEKLWLGADNGFLAHGLDGGDNDADQPILLTCGTENIPAGRQCLMAVDGAIVTSDEVNELERVCVIFDGNNQAALQAARGQWKTLTEAGCTAQYWAQDGAKWSMKSESSRKNAPD